MSEIRVTVQLPGIGEFLKKHFPVTLVPIEQFREADYFVGDTCTYHIDAFKGVRVLCTAENHHVDLNRFDYCLTHDYVENDRCHRLPYWHYVTLDNSADREYLMGNRPKVTPEQLVETQPEFCSFVCRNPKGKERNALVRALMKVRRVNCAGPFMNNTGSLLPYGEKQNYQRRHCFSMAYENESYPGYQTEKIIDAFVSGSIPIYWGNTLVAKEFNPASFVNAHDFRRREDLVDYLVKLADDPVRRAEMINCNILQDSDVFTKCDKELVDFFSRIFERGPGAIQRTPFQRFMGVLQQFYGHGLFRTIRYTSRRLRGKW